MDPVHQRGGGRGGHLQGMLAWSSHGSVGQAKEGGCYAIGPTRACWCSHQQALATIRLKQYNPSIFKCMTPLIFILTFDQSHLIQKIYVIIIYFDVTCFIVEYVLSIFSHSCTNFF